MAELKVLGAGPVKRGVTQVAAQFEKSSGHRVVVEFVGAPAVRDRILAGEAVDVAIVPAPTRAQCSGVRAWGWQCARALRHPTCQQRRRSSSLSRLPMRWW
jgi:hypothetical protein